MSALESTTKTRIHLVRHHQFAGASLFDGAITVVKHSFLIANLKCRYLKKWTKINPMKRFRKVATDTKEEIKFTLEVSELVL